MARAFNVKMGFDAGDDKLPERFFQPMRAGTLKGHYIDKDAFEQAKLLYYGMMGWDAEGRPTQAKLEELGVGWIWDEIKEKSLPDARDCQAFRHGAPPFAARYIRVVGRGDPGWLYGADLISLLGAPDGEVSAAAVNGVTVPFDTPIPKNATILLVTNVNGG